MKLKISEHPSLMYAEQISDICRPLEKLNISYFSHVKINDKKQFAALGSNPYFAEHYLKNKYYQSDIHILNKNLFGNFFVWDAVEFFGKSLQLCQEASEFNINNPFTIIHKSKDATDYYHFANHSTNKQINQIYLANIDLLELFIAHFSDKISESKSLRKAYNFTFDIDTTSSLSFETRVVKYDRTDFIETLKSPKHSKLNIDGITFSHQQSQILKLVVQGKTLKEISAILNLSVRTVGHYFETIKNKMNVQTRSELVSLIFQSDQGKMLLLNK